jgi:hypothetical protein
VDELVKGRWTGEEVLKEIGAILDARPPRPHRALEAEVMEAGDVPVTQDVALEEEKQEVPVPDENVHEPETPAVISSSAAAVPSDKPQTEHEAVVPPPLAPPMFAHSVPPVQIATAAAVSL